MTTQKRWSTAILLACVGGLSAFALFGAHGSPDDPFAGLKPERMRGGYGEQRVRIEQYPEIYRFDSPEQVTAEIGRPVWRLTDTMGRESSGYLVSHIFEEHVRVEEFFEDFRFSQSVCVSLAAAARWGDLQAGPTSRVRAVEGWVTEVGNYGIEYSPARVLWVEGDTVFVLEGRSVDIFAEDLLRMAESMELQVTPGGAYRRYPGIGTYWLPAAPPTADPGRTLTLHERVARAGMKVDSFEIAANHVTFPVADLGRALRDAESIIVDDKLFGPDGSFVTRYDTEERWVSVFMPNGTVVTRGLQVWEDSGALADSEMGEAGAEEWKHRVELDGIVGIAWSFGMRGGEVCETTGEMLYGSIIPTSVIAWSVDGVTTIMRSTTLTHEEMLPLAFEIRAAHGE